MIKLEKFEKIPSRDTHKEAQTVGAGPLRICDKLLLSNIKMLLKTSQNIFR